MFEAEESIRPPHLPSAERPPSYSFPVAGEPLSSAEPPDMLVSNLFASDTSLREAAARALGNLFADSPAVAALAALQAAMQAEPARSTRSVLAEAISSINSKVLLAQPLKTVHHETRKGEPALSAPQHTIEELFSTLPHDPRERLTAVADLYRAIRERAAIELLPAITAILRDAPGLDYDQKLQLSQQVNQVLLDARLALLDPDTRLPAKLTTHRPRPSSAVSTLRVEDTRASATGRRNYLRAEDLDLDGTPLQLVSTAAETGPTASHPQRPSR